MWEQLICLDVAEFNELVPLKVHILCLSNVKQGRMKAAVALCQFSGLSTGIETKLLDYWCKRVKKNIFHWDWICESKRFSWLPFRYSIQDQYIIMASKDTGSCISPVEITLLFRDMTCDQCVNSYGNTMALMQRSMFLSCAPHYRSWLNIDEADLNSSSWPH